jgi:hypothetical protein
VRPRASRHQARSLPVFLRGLSHRLRLQPETLSLDGDPLDVSTYKQLDNKEVDVEGCYSREDAVKEIAASRRRVSEAP